MGNQGAKTLNTGSSNHLTILLSLRNGNYRWPRHKHLFRFEANWTKLEERENIIKKHWAMISSNHGSLDSVKKKLYQYSQALFHWNSKQRSDSAKDLEDKTNQLNLLQAREGPGDGPGIRKHNHEIELVLEMENLRQKQQAKRT